MEFTINGSPGHGSLLLDDTAGVKMNYILNKLSEFRREQVEKLQNNPELTIGDVTTVNLTKISGGVQSNVIPPQFHLTFDIRFALHEDMDQFDLQVFYTFKSYTPVWIKLKIVMKIVVA